MKTKTVVTIAHQDYELVRTPKGENCCALCALSLFCFDNHGDPPCVELTQDPDWHFVKRDV
jgi:hypothetical protein